MLQTLKFKLSPKAGNKQMGQMAQFSLNVHYKMDTAPKIENKLYENIKLL